MNILNLISNKLNNIARYTLLTIFLIFLTVSLIIKPMYDFRDFPYFSRVEWLDYLMIVIFILGSILLNKYKEYLDRILSKRVIASSYFFIALFFVLMIPLNTFSDMKQVFNGAVAFANFDFISLKENAYFTTYPNNILITIFYGIILFILPKQIVTMKIINIIMILIIAKLTCSIVGVYYKKYSNIFFFLCLSLISVFLYANHIYTDIPFTLLSLIAVYLYLKSSKNICISIGILMISYFIRPLAIIYLIAILIDFVLKSEIEFKAKIRQSMIMLVCSMIIFVSMSTIVIPCFIRQDITRQIPAVSYVYMAFNKEKFGFQDGSHSPERSLNEVIDRLKGYSVHDILEILTKKSYWMWMEGTYQAQRYAFGEDNGDAYLDKFQYNTPVLKFISNSVQKARRILNSLLYGQYVVLFALMILGIKSELGKKMNAINLIVIGFFLFYLFWEIKSRYIFSLYPFMIIYAGFVLMQNFSSKVSVKING